MSCNPFNPSQGPFITDRDWDSASNFGTWSLALDTADTSVNRYNLKNGAATQDAILVEDDQAIAWVWYVNFLLVRIGTTSGGIVNYRMYVYDLRSGSIVKNPVDLGVTTLTANLDAAV
ncbi:MAG TPA: hypothetical protein VFQ43_07780, partial [Nitrososphaera sp.]|nr:hypothetical protein [Nitrososphaera sp.]